MDAVYNEKGEQIPDNTPVELPLGYEHPEDLQSIIRRMVTDAVIVAAQEADGVDTEEEADDFDVMDEEGVAPSNYEYTEMQEEQVKQIKQARSVPVEEGETVVEKKKPKVKTSKKVEESVEEESVSDASS